MAAVEKSQKSRFRGIGSIIIIAVVVAVGFFSFNMMTNQVDWPAQFRSNGEQIYFTATSASGLPIVSQGGGMHMGMMGGGCVTCHGVDRRGARLMHKFWKTAPALTSAALFKEHSENSGDDGHGDHDGYSEETLGRAITQGIDPEGKSLSTEMPRWTISAQDLDDLIAYLKTPDGNHQ